MPVKAIIQKTTNLSSPIDGIGGSAVASIRTRWWPTVTNHATETSQAAARHVEFEGYSLADAKGTLLGSGGIDVADVSVQSLYGGSDAEAIIRAALE